VAVIIDKTGDQLVDRAEFIDAIQSKLHIVIGKAPLASATSLAISSLHASSSSSGLADSARLQLVTFNIRKLGFTVALQQGIPVADISAASPKKAAAAPKKQGPRPKKALDPNENRGRLTSAPQPGIIMAHIPAERVRIGSDALVTRMPPSASDVESSMVIASAYYMNNRQNFSEFVTSLFQKYGATAAAESDDADEFDCSALASSSSSAGQPFKMLTHQKIVRDYLNVYSPYRGLLLFHGLGSGKTCSSIAIAEGLKTHKRVIVMTPASLQTNYREELKKCGDEMYKRNQFWEFLDLHGDAAGPAAFEKRLLELLGFSKDSQFIKAQGGAWFVNINKPSNYQELSQDQRSQLDAQITQMIDNKYQFINYNGVRLSGLQELTSGFTKNPFDDCVVIIDEAHNFVSRIVNKLKKPASLSMQFYEYLLNAKNAKIVMLTGTPIINYPNEIGVLFNILRGYIKTWNFTLDTSGVAAAAAKRVDKAYFQRLFTEGLGTHDYLDYKQTPTPTLTLTRNPFGFVTRQTSVAGAPKYAGVSLDLEAGGSLTDEAFQAEITDRLRSAGFKVQTAKTEVFKALPDTMDGFNELFIDPTDGIKLKNDAMFSRRIMGMTSYFRSAQEKLMPKYDPERGGFQKIDVEMSDYQFEYYKHIRDVERKQESDSKKRRGRPAAKTDVVGDVYGDAASTYRIFSRSCCNFVFPEEEIPRPMPGGTSTAAAAAAAAAAPEDAPDKKKKKPALAAAVGAHLPRITEQLLEGTISVKGKGVGRGDAGGDDGDSSSDDGDADEGEVADATGSAAVTYDRTLQRALAELKRRSSEFLTPAGLEVYSPKFLNILENISDAKHRGLHLLYSQFRTLEGIGIFKLVLEANGYAQFKVKAVPNAHGDWEQVVDDADAGKPLYALYTGTETTEMKELIRNVYNGMWDNLPTTLQADLKRNHGSEKNKYGAAIKLLMITASGAEGINLRNVRFVHIMEPYWHPVRTEQIIGRANRICSHVDLPEAERTVNVFLYVMKFTKTQMEMSDRGTTEIRKHDVSKIDPGVSLTTDESLFEISEIKKRVNSQLLMAVKASAMDCALHKRPGSKENIQCFSYGQGANATDFGYVPDISKEPKDRIAKINEEKKTIKLVALTLPGGKQYAYDKTSGRLYDYHMYTAMHPPELVFIGNLVTNDDGTYDVVVSGSGSGA
jgi:hypothetical protein